VPPIDLSVRRGDFLAVVGRNGSGKTTWLRTVVGLLPPLGGVIDPPPGHLVAAYVPQASSLEAILPVRASQVVEWGLASRWSFLDPFSARKGRARANEALERMKATELARRRFRDLSPGQKQRILLARALATGAPLLLFDEPSAAMDVVAEEETFGILKGMAAAGNAVVVICHDLSMVARNASRLLFLDRADSVAFFGSAEEVFAHPVFRKQYGGAVPVSAEKRVDA
jgi:zinc transport system ATP-binding protein